MAIDCPGHDARAFPTRGVGKGAGLTAEAGARADAETEFARDQAAKWVDAQRWLDAQTCKKTGCKPGFECVIGKIEIKAAPGTIDETVTFGKSPGFDRAGCVITGSVSASAFCRCVTAAEAKAMREEKLKKKKGTIKIR